MIANGNGSHITQVITAPLAHLFPFRDLNLWFPKIIQRYYLTLSNSYVPLNEISNGCLKLGYPSYTWLVMGNDSKVFLRLHIGMTTESEVLGKFQIPWEKTKHYNHNPHHKSLHILPLFPPSLFTKYISQFCRIINSTSII